VLASWYDALTFANWKSIGEGLVLSYIIVTTGEHVTVALNPAARGYRIPTEAEWNQAARAGTVDVFSPSVLYKRKPDIEADLSPGPWCSEGAIGPLHEWCWDSLDVDRPARQSDWEPGVKLAGICRVVGSIMPEYGKFLDVVVAARLLRRQAPSGSDWLNAHRASEAQPGHAADPRYQPRLSSQENLAAAITLTGEEYQQLDQASYRCGNVIAVNYHCPPHCIRVRLHGGSSHSVSPRRYKRSHRHDLFHSNQHGTADHDQSEGGPQLDVVCLQQIRCLA